MENEEHYEPGEFDKLILAMANGALTKFPRLTDDDRTAIESGLRQFKFGRALLGGSVQVLLVKFGQALLRSGDPELLLGAVQDFEFLLDAARHIEVGAYAIGSRANVSDSAKIKADIDAHAAQGHGMVKARRKEMDIWHARVREILPDIRLKHPKLSAERLEPIVRKKAHPISLPSPRTVIGFVRRELKALKTKDRRPAIKLVHTG